MKRKMKVPEATFTPGPTVSLPLGCEERDRRTIDLLLLAWERQEYTLRNWDKVLAEIEKDKTYERYPFEAPAGSLDNLLRDVIGVSIAESRRTIEERTKAQAQTIEPVKKHGTNQHTERGDYNCNVLKQQGNSASYLTARIARDFPEALEDMKNGKFRSVRQAAISVAIVKENKYWSAPKDIEKLAEALVKRFTPEELQQLREMVKECLSKKQI